METPPNPATVPFEDAGQILYVRRAVPGFSKRLYPRHLEKRTIRGAAVVAGLWIMPVFLWIVLSPLVLLSLKVVEQRVEVVDDAPQFSQHTEADG